MVPKLPPRDHTRPRACMTRIGIRGSVATLRQKVCGCVSVSLRTRPSRWRQRASAFPAIIGAAGHGAGAVSTPPYPVHAHLGHPAKASARHGSVSVWFVRTSLGRSSVPAAAGDHTVIIQPHRAVDQGISRRPAAPQPSSQQPAIRNKDKVLPARVEQTNDHAARSQPRHQGIRPLIKGRMNSCRISTAIARARWRYQLATSPLHFTRRRARILEVLPKHCLGRR
jgi:hypothetical protein